MPPCPCALAVCLCAAGLVRAEQQTPPAPPDAEMSSAIEEFKIGWGGKRCCQFPADHYLALLYHR